MRVLLNRWVLNWKPERVRKKIEKVTCLNSENVRGRVMEVSTGTEKEPDGEMVENDD